MFWDGVASPSSRSHPVAPYSSSSVVSEIPLIPFHELQVRSFRDSCLWRTMSLDTFLKITPFGPMGECLLMTTLTIVQLSECMCIGDLMGAKFALIFSCYVAPGYASEGHKQEEYCGFYRQEKIIL
uniref:Uncharacterized protein n=1 Tax=Oryza punctata TaxID=4537 RepID=A0A0E0K0I6_ORYPU